MRDDYQDPLCGRYASEQIRRIFSDHNKFSTWRRLWVTLAESERELGLNITEEQIDELKLYIDDINYDIANEREKTTRHDVMAHIYAYGEQAKAAKPIIHLGATSCFVGDNTDVLIMKQAISHTRALLCATIAALCDFAEAHKDEPTLAYTHFQAAQPTTVGKRAACWAQDFLLDLEALDFADDSLKMLGCRGTTGTCASFLSLFDGDGGKVEALEQKVLEKIALSLDMKPLAAYAVSGQTYTRKADYTVLSALSGVAQSAYKFSNDIRLLSHLKEFDEPFEDGQVGSSAMAYKRNPMRGERAASLSRHIIALTADAANTAAGQWFERTLDDSANRRIAIPEAFLAADAVLNLVINITRGCRVYTKTIEKHLREELPFMVTENILMRVVKNGGDRQAAHEALRRHSIAAARRVKEEAGENDLLDRLAKDPIIGLSLYDIEQIVSFKDFVGIAPKQAEDFIKMAREKIGETAAVFGEVRV